MAFVFLGVREEGGSSMKMAMDGKTEDRMGDREVGSGKDG